MTWPSCLSCGRDLCGLVNWAGQGRRSDLILSLCQQIGATTYYSAAGSSAYLEQDRQQFEDAGIEVKFQDWQHPVYQQRGEAFVSHLSVVDAIANVGVERTREFLCAEQN